MDEKLYVYILCISVLGRSAGLRIDFIHSLCCIDANEDRDNVACQSNKDPYFRHLASYLWSCGYQFLTEFISFHFDKRNIYSGTNNDGGGDG